MAPLATATVAQEASAFCQGGFVAADSDEDGVLSGTEIDGMRAGEFGALDADADDTVTREEFAACMAEADQREIAPREVAAAAEGVAAEMPALEDGSLTREEFMEAAELAYDATRNEEENAIEWARNFVLLTPDEGEPEIREMTREEFAARSAALFLRLDADGNDQLSAEEWRAEVRPAAGADFDAAFDRMDADGSGDISREEYMAAGTERAERARLAALARGWGGEGTSAGGVETVDEEGAAEGGEAEGLVATDSPASMAASGEGEGVPAFDYYFDRGE